LQSSHDLKFKGICHILLPLHLMGVLSSGDFGLQHRQCSVL
jgi:hypothetical protein